MGRNLDLPLVPRRLPQCTIVDRGSSSLERIYNMRYPIRGYQDDLSSLCSTRLLRHGFCKRWLKDGAA